MGLRLLAFTALIFAYGFADKVPVLLTGPAVILALGLVSRQPLGKTLTFLKAPLILLIMLAPFILFTPVPGGTALFSLAFLTVYREGIVLLITIALRSLTVFGLLALLVNGSSPYEAAAALRRIGIPGKLIVIFLSTWRYINLYLSDLGQLIRSARLRGFSLTRGLKHWSVSADILLTLLIRSYEQSERVQAAMVTRGFTGELPLRKEKAIIPAGEIVRSAAVLTLALSLFATEILC